MYEDIIYTGQFKKFTFYCSSIKGTIGISYLLNAILYLHSTVVLLKDEKT